MRSVNRKGTSRFGIGAISDGEWKLTVQITNFESLYIEKGTAVKVKGIVKMNSGNF